MSAATKPARRKGRAQITAREVPAPINWHEGMLLAPQHFQQQSLRHELLVHYHAAAVSPFHWGVRHLEIDRLALVDGTFRIHELEGVMPDGLAVSHAQGDVPLSIDLKAGIDEMKQRPMTVHLAIVARGLARKERYASEDGAPVADENTGESSMQIPVLKPNLQLLLGEEVAPKYVAMPLARIAFRDEAFALTPYEPPWLRVAPGSVIYELCDKLAARLRAKATFLADQARSTSAPAGVSHHLDTKIRVHALIGELPAFEALLRSGVSHPFPLYVALCSLLGHVAGLGRALVPKVLAPYDHNELLSSFDEAEKEIAKAVDEGIQEAYTPHRFAVEGDAFHLRFNPNWAGRQLILGVQAPSGVSDQEMSAWVLQSVIASSSKIMLLRDKRVTGARREPIGDAAELVPPRGMTLYALPESEYVTTGEDLVVLSPGDGRRPRPEVIVLYVRNAM